MSNKIIAVIVFSAAILGYFVISPSNITGYASVIDGDTLDIDGTKVRLYGIDAPEIDQTCGQSQCGIEVRNWLRKRIRNLVVFCQKKDTDKYGRSVATCYVEKDHDIAEDLVLHGFARSYHLYSHDYDEQEKWASDQQVGMWSPAWQPFMHPARWRYLHR